MKKNTEPQSGWQLKEDGPAAYEKYIVPAFSGTWAKDIVERAGIKEKGRILDLGCGTGIVCRHVRGRYGHLCRIMGVDINETVLKAARRICEKLEPDIEFRQADVTALPFKDAQFNRVLCQQGLQYFPDKPAALHEVHRVLDAGGRAVFSVWRAVQRFPFYKAVHDALEKYVNPGAASILASAFTLDNVDRLRLLFKDAGFRNIGIRLVIRQMRYAPAADFIAGGFAASPFAPDIQSMPEARRKEMFTSIIEGVSDYIDDTGLAAPMETWVVTALK